MKFKKAIGLIILSLPFTVNLKAQIKEGYKAEVEVQAIGTTNGTVPFWMRSNQFGSVPLNGVSGSVIGRLSKDYAELSTSDKLYGRKKVFDWGFGFEGRANGGKNSNLQLIEGYVKAKAWIFQLKAGRAKDVTGINGDTSLTSGNFVISGNALGIPKIELSIPEYYTVPLFNGLFAFKGTFAHGWVGTTRMLNSEKRPETYFHQKSLYGKLSQKDWRLSFEAGFNHQSYWGAEKVIYGDLYTLSDAETFLYVLLGKAYHSPGIPGSKIGNQIGSIDLAVQYDFPRVKVKAYRQQFYDIGGLFHLANLRDGLNGISFHNNSVVDKNGLQWKAILLEVFHTYNQGGEVWSKPTPSGPEDYYNNYMYRDGWSYGGENLGNPFITSVLHARPGQANSDQYFINNRVTAFHIGFNGSLNDYDLKIKTSYSLNYGTFQTSPAAKLSGNIKVYNTDNLFKKVNQFSLYVQSGKSFKNNLYMSCELGFDNGQLLENSLGIGFKLKKSFN
jgi:hypothetical protein